MTLQEHINISDWMRNPAIFEARLKAMPVIDRVRILDEIENTYPIKPRPYDPKKLDFNIYTKVFDLVLGQFIMIEQIFTGKAGVQNNLLDYSILRLILRPKEDLLFDNTDLVKEKENDKRVLAMDVVDAMSILKDFVDDRNKTLFNDFKGVFYDPEADKEEDEERDELKESNETFEYKFKEQWYWYNIVRRLAGEDVLKYEQVYMLKMETVLPELSFLIQKAKLDKAAEFRAKVANKL